MKNILRKNKHPELTVAMRAEMIADLDAESRERERQWDELTKELAKKKLSALAISQDQDVQLESEEVTHEN